MEDFVKDFTQKFRMKNMFKVLGFFPFGVLSIFSLFSGKIEGTVIEVINKIGSVFLVLF